MNKVITSNSQHPLFDKIKGLKAYKPIESLDLKEDDFLFDLSALPTKKKRDLFKRCPCSIISDLSLNSGSLLLTEYENLKGAIATVFPSPNMAFEYTLKKEHHSPEIKYIAKALSLTPIEVSSAGIGFIFPRTVAQIMNEAWYALEDDLASEEAIDTAMLYGVNYPQGPVNWSRETGLSNIVVLLEELHSSTNQDRYKVCQKLKEASL